MKLVLASASERRRELLSWFGIPFKIVVSDFDEDSVHERDPALLVQQLALEKAKRVVESIKYKVSSIEGDGFIILGADTVIYCEGEIIGKPGTGKNAVRILRKLSGKTHEVFTGVVVLVTRPGLVNQEVGVDRSEVTFRKLSDKEIQDYVDTGEPLDKGGGYAIQMRAKDFVKKVTGSYTNVVGLPLLLAQEYFKKCGYDIDIDMRKIIKEKTGYSS